MVVPNSLGVVGVLTFQMVQDFTGLLSYSCSPDSESLLHRGLQGEALMNCNLKTSLNSTLLVVMAE